MVFFAAGDLPPSAERVLEVLGTNGPLTHKELIAATRIPARTVRFALARLRTSGRVEWRWSLRDARQRVYFVRHIPAALGPSLTGVAPPA